jgi:hypothetical protein
MIIQPQVGLQVYPDIQRSSSNQPNESQDRELRYKFPEMALSINELNQLREPINIKTGISCHTLRPSFQKKSLKVCADERYEVIIKCKN